MFGKREAAVSLTRWSLRTSLSSGRGGCRGEALIRCAEMRLTVLESSVSVPESVGCIFVVANSSSRFDGE